MTKPVTIAFLVLHYNAVQETMACVESIRRTHKGLAYKIIIVDNCSPDGSGKTLDTEYETSDDVKVLHTDRNLGFARGNNVGFRHAKTEYDPDYIVMLNNDTLVLQDDFLARVQEEYRGTGFAVLGPVVETPKHFNNLNPLAYKEKPLPYYLYFYMKCLAHYLAYSIGAGALLEKLKKKALHKKAEGDGSIHPTRETDVKLQGCFWVFSRKYIDMFDGLHEGTFLYMEEDLLYHRLRHAGLKSVYTPKIRIYHKEDASTESVVGTSAAKQRFFYRHHLRSTRALIAQRIKDLI